MNYVVDAFDRLQQFKHLIVLRQCELSFGVALERVQHALRLAGGLVTGLDLAQHCVFGIEIGRYRLVDGEGVRTYP
jgi:hypothetical protein